MSTDNHYELNPDTVPCQLTVGKLLTRMRIKPDTELKSRLCIWLNGDSVRRYCGGRDGKSPETTWLPETALSALSLVGAVGLRQG